MMSFLINILSSESGLSFDVLLLDSYRYHDGLGIRFWSSLVVMYILEDYNTFVCIMTRILGGTEWLPWKWFGCLNYVWHSFRLVVMFDYFQNGPLLMSTCSYTCIAIDRYNILLKWRNLGFLRLSCCYMYLYYLPFDNCF
jgi:hypothetical protein